MVRPRTVALATCLCWSVACIGISGDPRGEFNIVSMTVTPAGGAPQTLTDAGTLQLGNLLTCDTGALSEAGRFDGCGVDAGLDAASILAYDWVGTGFVPSWEPRTTFFALPPWDGANKQWSGPIPLGDLSCVLTRENQDPLELSGAGCAGPEGGLFDVVLTMDR